MLSPASRFTIYLVFIALLISSCNTSGAADQYPTYDPFAPVDGGGTQIAPAPGGQVIQSARSDGPAPTRAPISVIIPSPNPNSSRTTPTPDAPHALPTQRDFLDQYSVQAGDTLGSIAQAYGITLEALMQANGLNETSVLSIGMVLNIPPIEADPNPGSSFKIIPDSELVYGPASAEFDLETLVQGYDGYLKNYMQDVNGEYLSCTDILQRVA
jgi:LysM repeat protein